MKVIDIYTIQGLGKNQYHMNTPFIQCTDSREIDDHPHALDIYNRCKKVIMTHIKDLETGENYSAASGIWHIMPVDIWENKDYLVTTKLINTLDFQTCYKMFGSCPHALAPWIDKECTTKQLPMRTATIGYTKEEKDALTIKWKGSL